MSPTSIPPDPKAPIERSKPTRFLLRGLAITLPPILTVVILIKILGAVNHYIITPASNVVCYGFAYVIQDSVKTETLKPWEKLPPLEYCQTNYRITGELKTQLEHQLKAAAASSPQPAAAQQVKTEWVLNELDEVYVPFGNHSVPYEDFYTVASNVQSSEMPATSFGVYVELVTIRYFSSILLSAAAVVVTVISLYFIGRIMTVQIGQWMVANFEKRVLARLPVISTVYSSVKQVTDFLFTERTVSYNQVVAVEYPRKGVWSLGFVTGSGMKEVMNADGEPLLALLMPTSPMPMTGFTVMVPQKDCIKLNLTIDQAFQFCLSCGVLVPPQQKVTSELLSNVVQKSINNYSEDGDAVDPGSSASDDQLTGLSSSDSEKQS